MNWREELEREEDIYVEENGYDRIEIEDLRDEFKTITLDEYEDKINNLEKQIELMIKEEIIQVTAYKRDICGKLYETQERADKCNGKVDFNISMTLNNEEEKDSEIDIGFTYEYWNDLYDNGRSTWYCLSFDSDVVCLTEKELEELISNLKKIKDYRNNKIKLKEAK